MMEKDRFIAALLPFCDTVCEYDRSCGKLRVCKTGLAQGISDKWYSVDELRNIFRDGCAVSAEKDVWTRYLSGENLRGFFDGNADNDSFRLRLRQGGQAYRQYDIRIDRVNDNTLVISGRDTQEQEQDVLTGALSRNHYERDMSAEVFHGGVALVDMDDLKLYNDVYGHSVGDKALWALAEVIRRELGSRGSLVRYGGDEFLILVPQAEEKEFAAMLETVRQRVQSADIPGCGDELRLTVSIGCVMAQGETIAAAAHRADRLMYRAKRRKDAVVREGDAETVGGETAQRILIVDDAPLNRAILREMLGGEFQLAEAADGAECMEQLEKYGTDIALVLLDMIMPGMDGIQVLEEMQRRELLDDIPVIMITADTSADSMSHAYELGVADYIERPFDVQVVRRRVMNTVKLYARQRRLTSVLIQQARAQERSSGMMADVLARIVAYRNGEGGDHARHIRRLTELLLERLTEKTDRYRLTRPDCRRIAAAAMFHDIGKLDIPDEILNKPGKLTAEEFEIIKGHPVIGETILRSMKDYQGEPLLETAAEICRWHHERIDGKGYPDGLRGEEIPIAAQAAGLADVFDALVSRRVYKEPYPMDKAMDMIEAGDSMEMIEKYLHNEFINWNIRFVGLVDSTDTLIVGNKKTRQINGLVNEWQVEDQSINIRAILKNKQSNGLFTGSFAPYGYLKDPKDKYHLIIDEESAEIVREIFKKYANGQGATHICAYLNQKKIPIPSIYKYQKYQKYNCSKIDYNKISSGEYIWRTNTIYNILKNEVYIGTLIQHKNEGISYKNRKQRRVPKDKRIVVPHCHKAIIDKEIWNIVSKRFSKYKERIKSCDGGKINLFSGKIRCNCCGHIFYRDSKKIKEKEYAYWVCGNKYETAKVLCDNKAINEKDIYEIVINSINNQIEKYYDKTIIEEKYFKQRTPNKDKKKELLNEKEKLEKNINKSKNVITLLYEDRVNKIINEEEFLMLKNRTEANMNISKERIKQIEKKLKIDKNEKIELEDIIRKHTKIKKLDRFIIDEFVHQINIGEYDPKTNTRQIIIEWNFGINCSTT